MKTILLSLIASLSISCVSQEATLRQLSNGSIVNHPKKGTFLYRVHPNLQMISIASLDPSSGKLVEHNLVSTYGEHPTDAVIGPSKKFLYVANNATNSISIFRVDESNGNLEISNTTTVEDNPTKLAIHPSGNFLYVFHNCPSKKITTHRINQHDGGLEEIEDNIIVSGTLIKDLVIGPEGSYLYAATNQTLKKYSIANSGRLVYNSESTNQQVSIVALANDKVIGIYPAPGKVQIYENNLTIPGYGYLDEKNYQYDLITNSKNEKLLAVVNNSSNESETYITQTSAVSSFTRKALFPSICPVSSIKFTSDNRFLISSCRSDSNGRFFSLSLKEDGSALSMLPMISQHSGYTGQEIQTSDLEIVEF